MIGLPFTEEERIMYLQYAQFSCEGSGRFEYAHSGWVAVNDDLTSYLPDDTETRQGLTVMDEEFVTFGTNRIRTAAWRDASTTALSTAARTWAGGWSGCPWPWRRRSPRPNSKRRRTPRPSLNWAERTKERQGIALTLFF